MVSKTKLGWTILGRDIHDNNIDITLMIISMFTQEANISFYLYNTYKYNYKL